jgi:beta-glucosidase
VDAGSPILDADRSGMAPAVAAAQSADLVIAAVGDRAGLFGKGTSGEGCDVADLRLPGVQGELVSAVLETGTPTVLVVVSGRPHALGDYTGAAAVVQAFMPGEEGGAAIAGVLSGRINPAGKLPVQVPRLAGGQPSTYLQPPLGAHSEGVSNLDPTPLFPFGHGLSYTTYEYSDLSLSAAELSTDGELTVSGAGCSFVGPELTRIVDPGQVEIHVGRSVGDLPLSATVRLTGPRREVGPERVLTAPYRVR